MTKKIRNLTIALTSFVLVLACGLLFWFSNYEEAKVNTPTPTRTIEASDVQLDYQSVFNEFENPMLETNEKITTFEGTKTFNLLDFSDVDLVSELEIDADTITEIQVKYHYSYDAERSVITLTSTLVDEEGNTNIDSIFGVPFVDENGNLDCVFDCDDEYVLLSELKSAGMIENCAFSFKKAFKKVSSAVKKVCNTTVGKIGAVATIAIPAVIGAVCAVAAAPVVAAVAVGALAGAGIATATAIVSTKEQDGKVDWETVGICAGVGAAVGAIASGVAYGVTNLILSNGKVSKDIDMNKISDHVFSNDHIENGIMDLGDSKDDILTKLFDTATSNSSQWVEGSNEIHTIINGKETTIRFFVQNGEIINLDGFVGKSARVIGNLIDLLK